LFWRNAATDARVSVSSADASASALRPSSDFVLCAELSNPTWTPWGSIETEVDVAELRSVRDELVWAAGTASVFAAFFVASGALLRGGAVSVASVPSDSMAPGVRRGDALLVDRRRASVRAVAAGDVVLFAPPPRLASVILETRGSAPKSGELFVKRVVAVAGDELEIVRGAVFRNGSRETPYVTGTPVGVTAVEANADEAIASTAFENVENENGRPVTCDVCKTASYDLRPTRVPPGNVFVLGDNRGGSVDGHVWGYLPLENVRGVVRFRVGPLSRFGALEKTPVPF
jgi:signal peptidase I